MMKKEQTIWCPWHVIGVLGTTVLLLAFLGMGLGAGNTAYAASSAEKKAQEYAQQNLDYASAEESSGTTKYYLDIEEPEAKPTPASIDTQSLPKTGDSAQSRTFLMICGGLGVLAIAGLCVALKPRKLDDDPDDAEDVDV